MLSHKFIAEHPYRRTELVIAPEPPQVRDGVDVSRLALQEIVKPIAVDINSGQQLIAPSLILLYIAKNGFSIIFWNVFGLILILPIFCNILHSFARLLQSLSWGSVGAEYGAGGLLLLKI